MKIVTIKMDLVIDETSDRAYLPGWFDLDMTDKYDIAIYLTDKLYSDPEFFGDFGEENIVEIKEFE